MANVTSIRARIARAVYRACTLPGTEAPYDRLSLKIFYPAREDGGEEQLNAGLVPPDETADPCPVAIILPGINVSPESYTWLAEHLALQGNVVVTYTMIAEEMPGYISLTPGLDLSAITPSEWGKRPSAAALTAILDALAAENSGGLLEGCIDTGNVVLVGHSAGGSVALFNANRDWFPGVRGAASYGAHAGASTVLGFEPHTVLDLPGNEPLMIIGGTQDGVIAESGHRYGIDTKDPMHLLRRTFEESTRDRRGSSWLVEVDGANHFSLAYPLDATTGRPFLDWPEEVEGETLRPLLAYVITEFVRVCTGDVAASIDNLEGNKIISLTHRRGAEAGTSGAADVAG